MIFNKSVHCSQCHLISPQKSHLQCQETSGKVDSMFAISLLQPSVVMESCLSIVLVVNPTEDVLITMVELINADSVDHGMVEDNMMEAMALNEIIQHWKQCLQLLSEMTCSLEQ